MTEIKVAPPPTDGISSLCFSPTNTNLLGVSSWDGSVRLYNANTAVGSCSAAGSFVLGAPMLDLTFGSDAEKGVYSVGLDKVVHVSPLAGGNSTALGGGMHAAPIRAIVHSTVTQALYTGSWDATVKVWDPRAGSNALQASVNQPDKVYSMDLAHHRLVVATNNQHIMVWDTRNMSAPEMKRESSLKHQTRCVRAYLDGTGFAIASTEGRVAMEFFDPSPAVQAKKYAFKCHRAMVNGVDHVYPVNALAFHPIYGTFASGGADGQVNIWDGANKKRLSQFRKYPAGISALAWNSDGTMLAIASSYTFEEGDRDHPPDDVYVRPVQDVELRPKPRSTA